MAASAVGLQRLRPTIAGGDIGTGVDLDDCKSKFKTAWARIRAGLTEADIAKAYEIARSGKR